VLNEKMSYFLECDPGRVQVLNGASQAFPILRDSLRTKRVAIPSPTFGEYSRMFPDATTYPDKPGVEMGRIDRATETCDVVVVVNPNTPTGTSIATKELYLVAREHSQTTFVVDESFIAFSDQPSIVGYLEEQPLTNVVVLTSLSKSLGIPGLRLGFLYTCDLDINAAVGASLPVWNLNAPAPQPTSKTEAPGPSWRSVALRSTNSTQLLGSNDPNGVSNPSAVNSRESIEGPVVGRSRLSQTSFQRALGSPASSAALPDSTVTRQRPRRGGHPTGEHCRRACEPPTAIEAGRPGNVRSRPSPRSGSPPATSGESCVRPPPSCRRGT